LEFLSIVKAGNELAEDEALLLSSLEEVKKFVGVFKTVDQKLSGALSHLFETGDFTGKTGQTAVLYPGEKLRFGKVILVGLGRRDQITIEGVRRAFGFAGRKVRELKVKSISVQAFESGLAGAKLPECSQAMVEGILLSHYRLPLQNRRGK
jgi:leucyl aminopeptidase